MPALDPAALKKHLESGRLAMVYAFVGEDVRLVDRMVDAVEHTIDPADRPFAVDRLFAGDEGGSPVDIVAAARGLPMLGDRRIVFVMRAERLFKPKRASKTEDDEPAEESGDTAVDAGALEAYLEQPVPSTTLVFVATEIDRTRRLTKRLLAQAQVVEFSGLQADAAGGRKDARAATQRWIEDELIRVGRTIDPEAAAMLTARAGGDITKLRGDVERLLLFIGSRARITSDDVMEVVSEQVSIDDEWGVVNAIADGDAGRALREVGKRVDRGDSPHGMIGQLRWWVSSRLAEADGARVRGAIDALRRTDLALKSSGGDERVLLERLVVELTGQPLPQRGWRGR